MPFGPGLYSALPGINSSAPIALSYAMLPYQAPIVQPPLSPYGVTTLPGGAPPPGSYGFHSAPPTVALAATTDLTSAAFSAGAGYYQPFYFAHLIPVKLTSDNYLSWRAQILPLLCSRYLEGFVDGSLPCPSPHHPTYHPWMARDQAILSAILSSLSEGVVGLVLFSTTSHDAWAALETSFSSQSMARSHAIRTQLGEEKKHEISVTTFFNKVKGLADTLASIG